jgi:hypothetical protein
MTIPEIVKKYRGEKSLRTFSGELSEKLVEPVSYGTIKQWEDGSVPRYYKILPIATVYDDWRQDFALEMIREIQPERVGLIKPYEVVSVDFLPGPEDAEPVPVITIQPTEP